MTRQIRLPYGHESRTIAVPEENLAWVEGPKDAPPVADLREAVRSAIRNPIGSPPLSELVLRHGKRTLILVDDGTRSTPQGEVRSMPSRPVQNRQQSLPSLPHVAGRGRA